MSENDSGIDSAVSNVLSGSRLLLSHPGAAKFNQLYATPDASTTNLAETVNSRGRLRITSNSKAVGGRSDFYLSSSSLVSDIILNFSITLTNANQMLGFGWGFDAINAVECTYANSLIQSLHINGSVIREYLLLTCKDKCARERLLRNAGNNAKGAVGKVWASIPLPFLNQNAGGNNANYPLDFSVLNGPMTVSIIWNTSNQILQSAANNAAPTAITEFSDAYLTAQTSDLQDGAFSVKRAMNLNPSLVYSIPAKYLNTISYSINAYTPGDVATLNLNSAPAGMCSGIIFSVRPQQWKDGSKDADNNYTHFGSSADLSYLRLIYGGQVLYQYNCYEEGSTFDLMNYGDSLEYDEPFSFISSVAAAAGALGETDGGIIKRVMKSRVYHIPFCHNARKVFREHLTENLPSYSGATLQLEMTVAPNKIQHALLQNPANAVAAGVVTAPGLQITSYPGVPQNYAMPAAVSYVVDLMYVIEGLLEVSNGTVDLQL
jgi:hypothetical protein